jgi:hypothetical protein
MQLPSTARATALQPKRKLTESGKVAAQCKKQKKKEEKAQKRKLKVCIGCLAACIMLTHTCCVPLLQELKLASQKEQRIARIRTTFGCRHEGCVHPRAFLRAHLRDKHEGQHCKARPSERYKMQHGGVKMKLAVVPAEAPAVEAAAAPATTSTPAFRVSVQLKALRAIQPKQVVGLPGAALAVQAATTLQPQAHASSRRQPPLLVKGGWAAKPPPARTGRFTAEQITFLVECYELGNDGKATKMSEVVAEQKMKIVFDGRDVEHSEKLRLSRYQVHALLHGWPATLIGIAVDQELVQL